MELDFIIVNEIYMNKNIVIGILILVIVAMAGYFVWYSKSDVAAPGVPTAEVKNEQTTADTKPTNVSQNPAVSPTPTVPSSTGMPAPIFTVNAATNISSTSATLNATILGLMDKYNGAAQGQTSYFEYGTSPTNLSSTSAINGPTQGTLSIPISGLQPHTTYYFRAVANYGPNSHPANAHGFSDVASFTTTN